MTPEWPGMLLDHLWQSTLFAGAAMLAARVLHQHRAHVRYWVWLAASIKFLVPLTALVMLGGLVNVWVAADTPPARPFGTFFFEAAAQPFTLARFDTGSANDTVAAGLLSTTSVLVALWACGALFMATRWFVGARRLAAVLSETAPLASGRTFETLRRLEAIAPAPSPVRLALTADPVGPGVTGLLAPVLLWPDGINDRMSDDEVEALLAHELCHARRRDNLTASLHMAVEVLFWFHPVVWWIGGKLVDERERACDEAVLDVARSPQVYAEALLKAGAFYLEPPLASVSGVAGADLPRRIARIVDSRPLRNLSAWGRWGLITTVIVALVTPAMAAALLPPDAIGLGGGRFFRTPRLLLAWAPRARLDGDVTERARFSAVSLRASSDGERASTFRTYGGGRLAAAGVTATELIRMAYAPGGALPPYALDGVPEWTSVLRFDVRARAAHDFVNDLDGHPGELVAMLRNLLADRFHLAVHMETRTMPGYALVVATPGQLGPRMRASLKTCWRPGDQPVPAIPPHPRLWCKTIGDGTTEAVSMAGLASILSGWSSVRRPVADLTGLAGRYDIDLDLASPDRPAPEQLEERLGLRLEPREAAIEVVVVDRIDRPTMDQLPSVQTTH